MKRWASVIMLIIFFTIALTGCGNTEELTDISLSGDGGRAGEADEDTGSTAHDMDEDLPDLQDVKPNEAGKIMVLMYHQIGDKEGEWSRHYDNFRKDLQILYEKGYRLISVNDYLNNNIDVEAGYTPVVITFDDATRGQFNIIEEMGEKTIDPNCAVGIMEHFYTEHPDFGLEATFYLYYPVPFRQKDLIDYKLKYIVDNGMDIGNHTYTHESLKNLDKQGIQYQLGRMVAETSRYLPDYQVSSLALPYGINSQPEYREYVYSGQYEGIGYQNRGILLVGSNPAFSPADRRFDWRKIPRVRAADSPDVSTDMYDWLDYFDEHPEERYISDGKPDIITVPQAFKDSIDEERLGDKRLNLYSIE